MQKKLKKYAEKKVEKNVENHQKMLKIGDFQLFFNFFFNIFFPTFKKVLNSPISALINGVWLQSSFLINGGAIEVLWPPKSYI